MSKASHHSACTDLLGNEKRDSPETTVNKDGFLQGNRRESQSTGSEHRGQPVEGAATGVWGPNWEGPARLVHLGLGEGSEDRHQLLILHVVCAAQRDVEDVDWLLTDVLAMRAPLSPAASAQQRCHQPRTTRGGDRNGAVPTLPSSSS